MLCPIRPIEQNGKWGLKHLPGIGVYRHYGGSLQSAVCWQAERQSLAFSLGDEKGVEWIGAYDITADELLAGTDTAKTESKTAQAQMLILELLANGKRMPSAELEKAVNAEDAALCVNITMYAEMMGH